uniref:Uncharacterized protein n=1 Tax=Rhipicephalus appendiculatus TaxID=34631 RepID=A0A131Z4W6_RHIAP
MITAPIADQLVAYMSASVRATRMTLTLNQSAAGELQLGDFKLVKFDGLDVTLEAAKHADFLINTVINAAATMFKSVLKVTTEVMIAQQIRSSLKDINNLLSDFALAENKAPLV